MASPLPVDGNDDEDDEEAAESNLHICRVSSSDTSKSSPSTNNFSSFSLVAASGLKTAGLEAEEEEDEESLDESSSNVGMRDCLRGFLDGEVGVAVTAEGAWLNGAAREGEEVSEEVPWFG